MRSERWIKQRISQLNGEWMIAKSQPNNSKKVSLINARLDELNKVLA